MGVSWLRQRGPRPPQLVWSEWLAADEAGDAAHAQELASEMLAVVPDSYFVWFQAGLLSKALGRWSDSATRNARAVELFTPKDAEEFGGANPAAWNLGIA